MIREIVKIDRDLCNGCGDCIPNCHEGALQMIDGKATLVSELMCDGLGACVGHCPVGAITIEKREADAYDEVATVKEIIKQGKNVLIAHLQHLNEHNQTGFLNEAIDYLKASEDTLPFKIQEIFDAVFKKQTINNMKKEGACGCPGSAEISFKNDSQNAAMVSGESQLQQWPVQLHLVNPMASYFQNSDLLLAADCVAFAMGNFHQQWLKGKSLAIACPKLDSNMDVYVQKLIAMIDNSKVNTITVMIMEVPCCSGLQQMVLQATQQASRKVPVKAITISLRGEVLQEKWI